MDFKKAVKKQYLASLSMLKQSIEKCPDSLWNDRSYKNKFWHLCFHTLYFTDVYTQGTDIDFVPWEKHIQGFQSLNYETNVEPIPEKDIYSKNDILEYWNHIVNNLESRIDATDMEAISGVSWIPNQAFELQFHNIKHIQHHVGMLFERLRNNNIDVEWGSANK